MSRQKISETLVLERGRIACAACGEALAAIGESWKQHASLTTRAVSALPGSGLAVHAQVVLRQFACPRCGSLLDTETALPDDPFLEDIVSG